MAPKGTLRTCVIVLIAYGALAMAAHAQGTLPNTATTKHSSSQFQRIPALYFIRSFASANDFGPRHPILDRTLDIVAGAADPSRHLDGLQSPSALSTNSHHQVFVADPGAKAVHIFDFDKFRYRVLNSRDHLLGRPVGLAVDANDNLYVTEEDSRTILVYNPAGKFIRRLGKLHGGESYFETPHGLAVDRTTGNVYVCDTQRNMVVVIDKRDQFIRTIGRRGGGDQPGSFRWPTQVFVANGELFVMDTGNRRVQVFDTKGYFRRAIRLPYADRESGLAVDRDKNVYVTNSDLNTIQVFSYEGVSPYRAAWNTARMGELTNPTALWISRDECLYVVESGLRARVTVFQIGTKDNRRCRKEIGAK